MIGQSAGKLLASNGTANAMLVLTCLAVLWFTVIGQPSQPIPVAREGVWPTKTTAPITLFDDVGPTVEHHLVLFLHSACRYCLQEMPFYRELKSLIGEGGKTRFHVVGIEDSDKLRAYVEANGLGSVNLLPGTSVEGLPATPTILPIDSRGRVERSWQGVLSARQKAQLKGLL